MKENIIYDNEGGGSFKLRTRSIRNKDLPKIRGFSVQVSVFSKTAGGIHRSENKASQTRPAAGIVRSITRSASVEPRAVSTHMAGGDRST